MYADLLKEIYFRERQKLEGMRICQQEAKMRMLRLLGEVTDQVQGVLTLGEIEGRNDIHEVVKEQLLRIQENANQIEERLETIADEEREVLAKAVEVEAKNIDYSPSEYADYLYQLEKVYALETALTEEKLFPEAVYAEMSERERPQTGEKAE
jgi:hypothetical protein